MRFKQVFLIILMLFAVSVFGCEKQKNPSVTLLNGDFITKNTTVGPGGLLKFKWEVRKGKADLSTFSVLMNGQDLPGYPETPKSTDVIIDSIYLEGPVQTGNYAFSFLATDANGNIGDRAVVITVE